MNTVNDQIEELIAEVYKYTKAKGINGAARAINVIKNERMVMSDIPLNRESAEEYGQSSRDPQLFCKDYRALNAFSLGIKCRAPNCGDKTTSLLVAVANAHHRMKEAMSKANGMQYEDIIEKGLTLRQMLDQYEKDTSCSGNTTAPIRAAIIKYGFTAQTIIDNTIEWLSNHKGVSECSAKVLKAAISHNPNDYRDCNNVRYINGEVDPNKCLLQYCSKNADSGENGYCYDHNPRANHTKNGEITFHRIKKEYTVWDETYTSSVCVTNYPKIAEAALAIYAEHYLDGESNV